VADIYNKYILHCVSQGRIVSIVTRLHNRGFVVQFLAGSRDFSVLQSVEICPWAHPSPYLMWTRDSFPGSKAVVVWSLPLTFIYHQGWEFLELYLHSLLWLNDMYRGNCMFSFDTVLLLCVQRCNFIWKLVSLFTQTLSCNCRQHNTVCHSILPCARVMCFSSMYCT